MKKFSSETLRSPPLAFLLYIICACALIMIIRYFFPGEASPLPYFSKSWRTIRGLIEIFELFPALALAALVIPLGFIQSDGDTYGRFSPKFFKKISGPVTMAIVSAAIYGIIYFLAMPLAYNYEENLRFKGRLYYLAKERAEAHRDKGEWLEALQFTGVCESVWPESELITALRNDIDIHMHESIFRVEDVPAPHTMEEIQRNEAGLAGIPGMTKPLTTTSAMTMAEAAYADEDYFDAHWLATVAERLARPGSVEASNADRLAGRAWDKISSLGPNRRERDLYEVYQTKQKGYLAMNSGDYIRAFYIFQDLIKKTPNDPDVQNFLTMSENGATSISFFIDEMELSLEQNVTGALFSLPARTRFGAPGRAVIRIAGFFAGPDYAYGTGFEYLNFDSQSKPYVRMSAPYVKLLPRTMDDGAKVVVLLQSLDRHDENKRWGPSWSFDGEGTRRSGDMQIVLDVSYEDMLTLTRTRRGLANMTMEELYTASKSFGPLGYIPQTFEAEILDRLGTVLFFLPVSIGALILGWRYRARTRPRYMFVPMLPILPLVFHGIISLGKVLMYNFGIWLTLSFNFGTSIAIFGGSIMALLVIAMIGLAAQKEEE